MSDIPDATELLAIARSTLLDKLLPRVPEELRYDARMIANAMAIAAREHTAGNVAAQAEVIRLAALLQEHRESGAGAEPMSARAELNRRLAAQIRAGRFIVELDGGQHQERSISDQRRDRRIEAQGFCVLRFWNNQVCEETSAVLEVIFKSLTLPCPHPNLPPQAGEGN